MKLDVYKRLLRINAGFEQVLRSLAALERQRRSDAEELKRFRLRSRETQATLNSYLAAAIESGRNRCGRAQFPEPPGATRRATKNAIPHLERVGRVMRELGAGERAVAAGKVR